MTGGVSNVVNEYVDNSKRRRRFYQSTGTPKRTEHNLFVRIDTYGSFVVFCSDNKVTGYINMIQNGYKFKNMYENLKPR